MTVCAVVFDVGETLVDEERARRIQALAAAGVVAVHVRRGPWGPLQDARGTRAIVVEGLDGLVDRLASAR